MVKTNVWVNIDKTMPIIVPYVILFVVIVIFSQHLSVTGNYSNWTEYLLLLLEVWRIYSKNDIVVVFQRIRFVGHIVWIGKYSIHLSMDVWFHHNHRLPYVNRLHKMWMHVILLKLNGQMHHGVVIKWVPCKMWIGMKWIEEWKRWPVGSDHLVICQPWLTRPFQDHFGIIKSPGTSSAERW